jgi:succinyl-CoA synthetase beta subunit
MTIKGERVRKVLVTRSVEIEQEFYLSITIDRAAKKPVVIFSAEGGMEIEELAKTSPHKIIKFHIDPLIGLQAYQVRTALFHAEVAPTLIKPLSDVFFKLYQAFVRYRAQLVEINPLAVANGSLIAIDSKFIIDDDDVPAELAGWEEEELAGSPQERAARQAGLQYVKLDGTIGIIGNGAGLVMATLDLVALEGGRPANFLDIGGGASAEVMKKALEIVLSDPDVRGVFINIFGGITRCDEVARGLVETQKELGIGVPTRSAPHRHQRRGRAQDLRSARDHAGWPAWKKEPLRSCAASNTARQLIVPSLAVIKTVELRTDELTN